MIELPNYKDLKLYVQLGTAVVLGAAGATAIILTYQNQDATPVNLKSEERIVSNVLDSNERIKAASLPEDIVQKVKQEYGSLTCTNLATDFTNHPEDFQRVFSSGIEMKLNQYNSSITDELSETNHVFFYLDNNQNDGMTLMHKYVPGKTTKFADTCDYQAKP